LIALQTAGVDLPSLSSAVPKAHSYVRTSRLTAAELIYSPSQIALASFRLADPSLVDKWLGVKEEKVEEVKRKRGTEGGAAEGEELEREALVEVLEEIGEMITEAQKNPVDKARVKDVDMRLKWARNPEKDPKSALFVVFPFPLSLSGLTFPLPLTQVQEAQSGGDCGEGGEGAGEGGEASCRGRWERFRLNVTFFRSTLCTAISFVLLVVTRKYSLSIHRRCRKALAGYHVQQ
jgi:hypothetical protein